MVEWHSFGHFLFIHWICDNKGTKCTGMRKDSGMSENKNEENNLRDQFDLAEAAYKFSNTFESFYSFTDEENQIVLWAVNFSQL